MGRIVRDILLYAVSILVIGVCLAIAVNCQTHIESHNDLEEWQDTIGVKFVEVMSMDKELIYWKQEFRYKVKMSSFGYDDKTIFPKVFEFNKCYIVHYCTLHQVAYAIDLIKCGRIRSENGKARLHDNQGGQVSKRTFLMDKDRSLLRQP